jgi:alkylation response protein AidB-like acyl-CoA dehydrogenase
VTSAGHADYYIVSSGAIDGKGPTDSTLYLVEKNAQGIEWSRAWNGVGLRGNASGPMLIRNCHVDEAAGSPTKGKDSAP